MHTVQLQYAPKRCVWLMYTFNLHNAENEMDPSYR